MAKKRTFAVGVDYGTNSVRTLIVDTADGREVATAVFPYPSGEAGILLDPKDPNLARQNPADYIDGFFQSVEEAVTVARRDPEFAVEDVVGVGVDTTGSTPLPVDAQGMPLAMKPAFRNNLAAQAWLWKDHTSIAEAAEITEKARETPRRLSDQVRRHLQQRVVLVKGPALQADGPEGFCGGRGLGRMCRLHPRLYHRQHRPRHHAPRHLRRRP